MAICGYRLSHQVGRICVIRLLDRADANDDPFFFNQADRCRGRLESSLQGFRA